MEHEKTNGGLDRHGAVASVLPDLQGKFGPDVFAVGSDLQRYMKLRSM